MFNSWQAAGATRSGGIRSINEDEILISSDQRLFCVADGHGSKAVGKSASKWFIQVLEEEWSTVALKDFDDKELAEWLAAIFVKTGNTIYEAYEGNLNNPVDVTAQIVLAVQSQRGELILGNMGGTRAYLVNGGSGYQITSWTDTLEPKTRETFLAINLQTHAYSSVPIYQLGQYRDSIPTFYRIEPVVGDTLILCSDGVTTFLRDDELMALCNTNIADGVVENFLSALQENTPDNYSVIAICYQ